jgi:hypothetical protein
MSKHTATPWRARILGTVREPTVEIVGPSGRVIIAWPGFDSSHVPTRQQGQIARFVVRACNSHQEMVEALKAAVEASHTDGDCCCYCGNDLSAAPPGCVHGCPMNTARIALAKAEGR